MNGAPRFRLVEGDATEAARIDEADLARGCFPGRVYSAWRAAEGEDGVGVGREREFGRGDEQAARHSEVDQEFNGCFIRSHPSRRSSDGWGTRSFFSVKRHDDGLADAADGFDARAGEGGDDLGLGRIEGLRLAAGPDTGDALAVDAGVNACGDGFDLGKLRHRD
jgi:hypothetical protein